MWQVFVARQETLELSGLREVAALPTGIVLVDTLALRGLEQPFTYYEWDDDRQLHKASTEDVAFTRDMALRGIPQICAWSSWAGHWKAKCVGRPMPITSQTVSAKFRKAILKDYNIGPGEELIDVEEKEVGATGKDPGHGAPNEGDEVGAISRGTVE